MLQQLEDKVKKKIDNEYKEKVTLQVERDMFMRCVTSNRAETKPATDHCGLRVVSYPRPSSPSCASSTSPANPTSSPCLQSPGLRKMLCMAKAPTSLV